MRSIGSDAEAQEKQAFSAVFRGSAKHQKVRRLSRSQNAKKSLPLAGQHLWGSRRCNSTSSVSSNWVSGPGTMRTLRSLVVSILRNHLGNREPPISSFEGPIGGGLRGIRGVLRGTYAVFKEI